MAQQKPLWETNEGALKTIMLELKKYPFLNIGDDLEGILTPLTYQYVSACFPILKVDDATLADLIPTEPG